MSRALDRRISALEAGSPRAKDPWLDILSEVPMEALNALEILFTPHPTGEGVEAECVQILERFAPDAATLKRWLQAVEAP